jgi:hypothetical protein
MRRWAAQAGLRFTRGGDARLIDRDGNVVFGRPRADDLDAVERFSRRRGMVA